MKKIFGAFLCLLFIISVFSLFYFRKEKSSDFLSECVEDDAQLYYFIKALKDQNPKLCEETFKEDLCKLMVNKDSNNCKDNTCKAYTLKKSYLCEEKDFNCLAYTTGNQNDCFKLDKEQQKDCIAFALLDYEVYSREVVVKECQGKLKNTTSEEINLVKETKITAS
ncbi:hypothetical protein HY837_05335 [archaeon]|nr:hypothetical protein [archaeon]